MNTSTGIFTVKESGYYRLNFMGTFHSEPLLTSSFTRVDNSGTQCNRIRTRSLCERAARILGLSDTSASDDTDGNGPDSDPPYCYFESSTLTFNQDATNTGGCSTSDVCLCTLGSGTQGNAESFAFLNVDSKEGDKSITEIVLVLYMTNSYTWQLSKPAWLCINSFASGNRDGRNQWCGKRRRGCCGSDKHNLSSQPRAKVNSFHAGELIFEKLILHMHWLQCLCQLAKSGKHLLPPQAPLRQQQVDIFHRGEDHWVTIPQHALQTENYQIHSARIIQHKNRVVKMFYRAPE